MLIPGKGWEYIYIYKKKNSNFPDTVHHAKPPDAIYAISLVRSFVSILSNRIYPCFASEIQLINTPVRTVFLRRLKILIRESLKRYLTTVRYITSFEQVRPRH